MRIGQGFDVHALERDTDLIIGGVKIDYEFGLKGHSDADVLLHAISDALLGAVAEGDIGKHFPDTDPAYKGADSAKLLQEVYKLVTDKGLKLGNLDCTIIAEKPKMAPHIQDMRTRISELLEVTIGQVNVKATTSEKLGFTGRKEGIASLATVLLIED
ncbi:MULTISPECIES: 2-C-methyl-D-erythritol 2,4-cyclodiphosphate synthase [unclassified Geomicrobium]|uniref:2-C-methyl-D-erythritol 2,4-cyclodiphosphate synthase n=1 Tax=unclassified Geomicrobium TaxID=2628951 RepID=UPI00045ED2E8|nr:MULTISPECIES: 2-C-methyl-D-erythritol 2,4-cyclodiphosphate synthase [unclassified Geomicrobium]GAK01038.1 2-C-methyl-D-erythritol 2,4-cyclodiphosphate synthase [Geomicrobium sp. JCM 19055]GAK09529.1 2-C-methyl-D-erythritol 2,4-cyclodiphosphate synthase [Geomicrobium sp. JCM 19038]